MTLEDSFKPDARLDVVDVLSVIAEKLGGQASFNMGSDGESSALVVSRLPDHGFLEVLQTDDKGRV